MCALQRDTNIYKKLAFLLTTFQLLMSNQALILIIFGLKSPLA